MAKEENPKTSTNIQINYLNGSFTDHLDIIGYQVSANSVVVHDKEGTVHIYPLHTIQNITIHNQ